MKLNFKKILYLMNDATNLLLSKDREDREKKIKNLRITLIIVSILLVLSLVANIYFILK